MDGRKIAFANEGLNVVLGRGGDDGNKEKETTETI
jgi:hypothetical protein